MKNHIKHTKKTLFLPRAKPGIGSSYLIRIEKSVFGDLKFVVYRALAINLQANRYIVYNDHLIYY